MKTIQTFALLILLFTANTLSQDISDAQETDKISAGVESPAELVTVPGKADLVETPITEVPLDIENAEEEAQTVVSEEQETVSVDLETSTEKPEVQETVTVDHETSTEKPAQEISNQDSPDIQQNEEEIPEIVPEEVVSRNIDIEEPANGPAENPDNDANILPSEETLTDIPQNENNSPITISREQETSTDIPEETFTNVQQNEEENSTIAPVEEDSIPDNVNSSTEEPIISSPLADSQKNGEETPVIVNQDDSELNNPEPSTEGTPKAEDKKPNPTTFTASEVPAETTSNSDPLGTITCVCNCGIDSNLPQACDEETPLETPNESEVETNSATEAGTEEAAIDEQTAESTDSTSPLVDNATTIETTPVESEQETTSEQVTAEPNDITTTTISPCTEIGDFPDVTNCRKFISCSGNSTNILTQSSQCPERSAFNPDLRRCTRDLSPCLNEEPACLRASSLPNPNGDNSSYIWCVPSLLGGFHKYLIQCSENEVFIPLLGRCWPEAPQLAFGLGGLLAWGPSDRDIVRAELKLLKKEIKLKAKEEKLKRKMEEKAKARADKLAAKELKKQKSKKTDDDDDSEEEEDDD